VYAVTRSISSSLSRYKQRGPLPVEPPTSIIPQPRLNYKSIIENAEYHKQNLLNRKIPRSAGLVKELANLHEQFLGVKKGVDNARSDQGRVEERIKTTPDSPERHDAIKEATEIKGFLAIQVPYYTGIETKLLELGLRIPNVTHPEAPIGSEYNAITLSIHGPERLEPTRARDHWKICQELNLVNFDDAAVVTGSSWYYLQGAAALLEQALVNYALSVAIRHGYTPVMTPDVIKSDIATRCGFSPRDRDGREGKVINHFYHIEGSTFELVLAGTAEIPLAGMFVKKTFVENQLPRRLVAVGHAFRSEAGSRGADTRGLYRVHQFTKVELFAVTEEGMSDAMMEELRKIQIEIFAGLGFPFRYAFNMFCI
jgi:seryl-tRNA synthetase